MRGLNLDILLLRRSKVLLPAIKILASESVLLWPGRPCNAYQPSLMERWLTSAHPIRWTECQDSDRFVFRLKSPKDSSIGAFPALPAISKLYLSITVSGIPIASSVVAGTLPANRTRRASVNVTATPNQKRDAERTG